MSKYLQIDASEVHRNTPHSGKGGSHNIENKDSMRLVERFSPKRPKAAIGRNAGNAVTTGAHGARAAVPPLPGAATKRGYPYQFSQGRIQRHGG